jgi:hypothetical protein
VLGNSVVRKKKVGASSRPGYPRPNPRAQTRTFAILPPSVASQPSNRWSICPLCHDTSISESTSNDSFLEMNSTFITKAALPSRMLSPAHIYRRQRFGGSSRKSTQSNSISSFAKRPRSVPRTTSHYRVCPDSPEICVTAQLVLT